MNDAQRAEPGTGEGEDAVLDVVVVGAGVAGLACAHRLRAGGLRVVVLERDGRAGGKVGTVEVDGYRLERGPNSFVGHARAIWPLVDALGLGGRLVQAASPAARWIYRGGRLRALPAGPLSAAFGDWLSLGGKLRLAGEPFVAAGARDDESLYDFVARRCGAAFADGVIAPFTSGVYAGDPRRLGAKDAFPRMWRLEAEHGGLMRGAIALRRARRAAGEVVRGGLWNFDAGLGVLTDALAGALGDALRLGAEVVDLRRDGARWRVQLGDGAVYARHVVIATPPAAAAALLAGSSPRVGAAAAAYAATEVAKIAVVHLGGPDPQGAAPRGFGALIARGEGIEALGVLLPSSLFAGRAPPGCALYAVFLGGVDAPELVARDDDELVALARAARRRVFGAAADSDPTLARVTRWPQAIAQYHVGHRDRVAALRAALAADAAGVWLCGAGADGVSIDDALASGGAVAEAVLADVAGIADIAEAADPNAAPRRADGAAAEVAA